MKTLKTLILMMLILQCTAYAYDASDNSDRLSGASSSVFSPGYINAAKQKTEAIIGQLDPKKSFMERLIENIKGGVANNVDEAADTKVTADIKKKTSSVASSASASTGETTPAPTDLGIAGNILADAVDAGGGTATLEFGGETINVWKENGKLYFSAIGYEGNTLVERQQFSVDEGYVLGASRDDNYIITKVKTNNDDSIDFSIMRDLNSQEKDELYYATFTDMWARNSQHYYYQYFNEQYDIYFWQYIHENEWNFEAANNYAGTMMSEFWIENNINEMVSYRIAEEAEVYVMENSWVSSKISGIQLTSPYSTPETRSLSMDTLTDSYLRNMLDYNKFGTYGSSPYESLSRLSTNPLTKDATSGVFKGLLAMADILSAGDGGGLNMEFISRLVRDNLGAQSLTLPLTDQEMADQMSVALALANILKNPTEDQKLVIDAITNLLKGISEIEGEAGKSDELTKAENELLQMAAAVLLTQGIPDLLKEGEVENMKGMFKDLGASKDRVLLDYKESIRPYYNSIAKEIAANIAVLELKGIVNKKLTEEELRKMEPREIDKILANIRKNNDKSFELEYILQQDSKYRKEYLDPSKKLMEDSMKNMLGTFTKRLREALDQER